MFILKKDIDKKTVAQFDPVLFGGRIITVLSPSEAERAVAFLERQERVGIDTETRPSFAKGHVNKVALLQVSTLDTCFLFRLNMTGLTLPLVHFLQSEKPLKIGLSLKDDISRLKQKADFTPAGFLELQQYVSQMGVEAMSLQKIYALLFGQKISKSQRLSNWEADVLTDAQKAYAATDAWACLRIYEKLESLRQSGDYELEDTEIYECEEE